MVIAQDVATASGPEGSYRWIRPEVKAYRAVDKFPKVEPVRHWQASKRDTILFG